MASFASQICLSNQQKYQHPGYFIEGTANKSEIPPGRKFAILT